MTKRTHLAALALLATAATGASQPPAGETGADMAQLAERCARFEGTVRGELQITAATFHADGRTLPDGPQGPGAQLPPHCLVQGMINRREGVGGTTYGIGFELALPSDWNGRFLLQGGGGLNGLVRPAIGPVAAGSRPALTRGFAVASHDSGHQGEVFDASFQADQRAALDFAQDAVGTVTAETRALVEEFYGSAPHHSYMTGCSTGGREGMLASQRYPELFDGIVIGAPAMRPGYSNFGIEYAQVMLNRTLPAGEAGPAGVTELERQVISAGLRRQCDAADGRADGMIMNVAACRDFDIGALVCEPGESGGDCLAPERAESLALGFAGPRDASGREVYVPVPWDTGITSTGPGLPGYLPMGQPGVFGPANASREIDVDERIAGVRSDAVGRLTDTAWWTNLSTYLGHGGKLLYFHGVSDPWFSAFDTWDYFQRAREANGAEAWDDAARFYMVPGMMHCSGGNAFDRFDLLTPLVEWAEEDDAPEPGGAVATRSSGEPGEMPMCPHPSYARFEGGDPLAAASYSCAVPES